MPIMSLLVAIQTNPNADVLFAEKLKERRVKEHPVGLDMEPHCGVRCDCSADRLDRVPQVFDPGE